jgi:hypothetical protein
MAMELNNGIVTGTVEGTGAAINVSCGFTPRYVKLFNLDDAGALAPTLEWFEGMDAASGIKNLKIADNGTTGKAVNALVTTNGISTYAGSSTASKGFTIGADGDINASGETILYMAIR